MFNSNSDPFINALKSIGYLVIRLPKADMQPLQILTKDGKSLTRLGYLNTVLVPQGSQSAPKIKSGDPVAPINGQRTGDIKIGLGLSILGTIIGALGGSKLGLEAEYKNATSAVFEFQNVTEDRIEVDELDRYLGTSDINPANVNISKLLEADTVYVVTSVLKSNKFVFDAQSKKGTAVAVKLPVIQEIVGGNVEVKSEGGATTKLAYEGKIPLAFGFQALQIFFDKGEYTTFRPAEAVAVSFSAATKDTSRDFLDSNSTLVDVRD
jgi:hypothetical protein